MDTDARSLLVMLWRYRRRQPHPDSRLREILAFSWPERLGDYRAILGSLTGLVEEGPEGWSVTEAGVEEAFRQKAIEVSSGFDSTFLRLSRSPTNAVYNQRVYGWDAFSFNTLGPPQRELLLSLSALGDGQRFVDLGCATGAITAWIAASTGAQGVGIDIAASAISRASGEGVTFEVGDLDDLQLPNTFDVAVACDTLYFADDLPSTIGRVWRALKPGGRLVAAWGQNSGDFASSRLAAALPDDAIVTVEDVTPHAHALWRRGRAALDDLREGFAAEGLHDIWASR
ncbi:MAG: class I SAM-dependent methyltransferase, partial [Alphaproteobacteria bacterium]|nr:class I SAM-dependent methyltransferase [Alphaproteobacteria bacterium]